MTVLLVMLFVAPPPKANKPDRKADIQAARVVVAAVVLAAKRNAARDKPRRGDELTADYVRAAAAAAARLPDDRAAFAFNLAIGVCLDSSAMLRNNLLTRFTWREVETDAERDARMKVLGEPTIHGRHDLAQHFAVSAALTALLGASIAETMGLSKEWMDAAPGGSGFSFADLAADLGGIALATRIQTKPARLQALSKTFRVADHCPAPKGLKEGLSRKSFEERFGSLSDARFRKALAELRATVAALPGFAGQ